MSDREELLQAVRELLDNDPVLSVTDPEFQALVREMPQYHWARKDLSAVRVGWELRKLWEDC